MRAFAGAAVLVLAVLIIYSSSTSAYFFDDDFHWLSQTQSFAWPHLLDLSRYSHFYRPVIELYFLVGLTLFGCDPFPFHVASISLHLVTVAAVYAFARLIGGSPQFGFLAALFFAVQPGLTDAVVWIAAITDLLPVPLYIVTLCLHQHYLRSGARWSYALAFVTFAACHLTHESAASLLPMMLLAHVTFAAAGNIRARLSAIAHRWLWYLPFGAALTAFLAVAYVVNTRSYLVAEGHYAFGWHAIPNIVNYVLWLYVGQRAVVDYVVSVAVLLSVVVWGSARMRFAVAWIVVTLLPVAFFTWDNAPRYLYLPAAGFAMLVADLILALQTAGLADLSAVAQSAKVEAPKERRRIVRSVSRRWAAYVVIPVVLFLAVRFGVFAKKAADSFPARTVPYERFVDALRSANPYATSGSIVTIEQRFLEGVPELYRESAAAVGLCLPNLRLEMR